jgi:predicted flap endonuclease-1-like 5' DNA nuclease
MTACAEDLSSRLNLTQIELVDATNKIATDSTTFEEKSQQYIAERDDAFAQGFELVNRIQIEVQQRLKSLLEQRDSAFDKANRMLDDIRILQSRAQSNEETIRNLRRERGAVLMRARSGRVEYPRLLETPLPDHEQRQTKPSSRPARINYGGKTRDDAIRGLVYTSPPRFIDDLKRISGIAAVLESKLNEYGIYTYEQIFSWDAQAISEFSKLLVFKDRIDRDGWQAQARKHYHAKYVSRAA